MPVTMNPSARLPSTWRTAIGPLLTNRRIAKYALLGRYGEEAKLYELRKQAKATKAKVRSRFKRRWITRMETEYQ